jgi:cell wall-associated NlpC family hydrolase
MPSFSAEQRANAAVIARVGRSLGASSRDILIGIMTAMQESNLRNLNYGDRDSIGLFQQRNAWGSTADRLNPETTARMFFLGGQQGQRGLLDFKNRDQWSLTQAAQKVQVSAFPDAYAKHEAGARSLLDGLGDGGAEIPVTPSVGDSQPVLPGNELIQENGDLNLFPAGVSSSDGGATGVATAAGVESASAPGIESGDEMPQFSAAALFDGMDATTPNGGSTFEDLFPKQGTVGGSRERVGQLARQLLGTPYQWGGTDPDSGLDCSGFVQYVLRQVGVNLPRISAAQAVSGKRTALNALQTGDLVAWDNNARNGGADHIAIYLGNGQIIESPRPGLGVRIRTLDDDEDAWGVSLNY